MNEVTKWLGPTRVLEEPLSAQTSLVVAALARHSRNEQASRWPSDLDFSQMLKCRSHATVAMTQHETDSVSTTSSGICHSTHIDVKAVKSSNPSDTAMQPSQSTRIVGQHFALLWVVCSSKRAQQYAHIVCMQCVDVLLACFQSQIEESFDLVSGSIHAEKAKDQNINTFEILWVRQC